MYTTQVKTAALPVARWLDAYCRPERFRDACQACPDYGKVWSCPPGVPDARTAFAPFRTVCLVGVRVDYAPETIAGAVTPERTEELRQASYGVVKKQLLSTLLELEKAVPGSWTVAAGPAGRGGPAGSGRGCGTPSPPSASIWGSWPGRSWGWSFCGRSGACRPTTPPSPRFSPLNKQGSKQGRNRRAVPAFRVTGF